MPPFFTYSVEPSGTTLLSEITNAPLKFFLPVNSTVGFDACAITIGTAAAISANAVRNTASMVTAFFVMLILSSLHVSLPLIFLCI